LIKYQIFQILRTCLFCPLIILKGLKHFIQENPLSIMNEIINRAGSKPYNSRLILEEIYPKEERNTSSDLAPFLFQGLMLREKGIRWL